MKTLIFAPAHPSATGIGHVSGLVYNYVNITYTRYLLMVVYICLSSHYGCWHFNLFCAASCTACVIFWWILIVAPGFQVFHESLILSLQRLMNGPWLDWRFRRSENHGKRAQSKFLFVFLDLFFVCGLFLLYCCFYCSVWSTNYRCDMGEFDGMGQGGAVYYLASWPLNKMYMLSLAVSAVLCLSWSCVIILHWLII